VEVNANYFLNENSLNEVYADTLLTNQSNIAIIAYDKDFGGNRRYAQLLGSPTLNDTFVSMDSFGNDIYVLTNREDPP